MRLVDISEVDGNIVISLRYAGVNNILHAAVYPDDFRAQLDSPVAAALSKAATYFRQYGYRLVVWDAYRTAEVQKQLLATNEAHRDRYVLVDSNHCRGRAVDVTLMNSDGEYLDMGTDHDDFSLKAHTDTSDITEAQAQNRQLLASGMQAVGFTQWPYEWWHFDYTGVE